MEFEQKTSHIVATEGRNSSIELLRLLCMIFIVAYHVMLKTPMWAEAYFRAILIAHYGGVPVSLISR